MDGWSVEHKRHCVCYRCLLTARSTLEINIITIIRHVSFVCAEVGDCCASVICFFSVGVSIRNTEAVHRGSGAPGTVRIRAISFPLGKRLDERLRTRGERSSLRTRGELILSVMNVLCCH